MRSFGSLSLLFTAALSAFTYAAPAVSTDASAVLNKVSGAAGDVKPDVLSSTPALASRDDTPQSIAVIFTTAQAQLEPLTEKLTSITSEDATLDNITPIVAEIKTCLLTATGSLKLLVGADLSVILAPVEGTVALTVAAVGELVGGLLCLIFAAVGCLLNVVVGDVRAAVLPLLVDLCGVVAGLLQVVLGLVGGLLAVVLTILTPTVLAVIKLLGSVDLLTCLGIKL
ncbi:hypothetical protein BJ138DRAFT_1145859 [Hygrophoropsis aurantiaca]|uniref:Uncharacterized protein n=1 Tax=Hygrophoropsis aurantiaca TaxID=72124 RepID=A0ACB8AKQ6_9AGAM|nr:hypothetical protein BJ138DRAFT_1145859 [Hygrophoropsis aurantiaca]